MTRLAHKVALVTGASRGIGFAVAEAFGREGARVFMVGHQDDAALQAALTRVRATGTQAVGGLYDVSDPRAVTALADEIDRAFGTLDVLVNNAGVITPRPLLDITPEQFDLTIKVHLCGSFYTLREMTIFRSGPIAVDGHRSLGQVDRQRIPRGPPVAHARASE